jgi:hypothetical protein
VSKVSSLLRAGNHQEVAIKEVLQVDFSAKGHPPEVLHPFLSSYFKTRMSHVERQLCNPRKYNLFEIIPEED